MKNIFGKKAVIVIIYGFVSGFVVGYETFWKSFFIDKQF